MGRLRPPVSFTGKVYWNFALVNVRPDLRQPKAPPMPADIENDPGKRQAWWNAWLQTDEGRNWQTAHQAFLKLHSKSRYVWATVDRDGRFRIDDMLAGDYLLSVDFSEHATGHL